MTLDVGVRNHMSEEIELTTLRLDTQASIECRLACCPLPSYSVETCLVVSFVGTIDDTSSYTGGYSYMHAMIGAGFAACNPATLILDLRELEYESGDSMNRVLDQRIIAKVVVSDLNRNGLTQLVRSVLFLDPQTVLFESVQDAVLACDSAYRDFLRDGRKKIIATDF